MKLINNKLVQTYKLLDISSNLFVFGVDFTYMYVFLVLGSIQMAEDCPDQLIHVNGTGATFIGPKESSCIHNMLRSVPAVVGTKGGFQKCIIGFLFRYVYFSCIEFVYANMRVCELYKQFPGG